MFGKHLLPIFILIFLIICFLLIVWLQGREKSPPSKESFINITTGGGSAPLFGMNRFYNKGSMSGSYTRVGSSPSDDYWPNTPSKDNYDYWVHYQSQLDYEENTSPWGPPTSYDTYYDKYAKNEEYAAATMVAKLKDLTPVKYPIPQSGASIGTFDPQASKIPWDGDNVTQNQSDIVWGQVSQEASKSIFMKNWLQNVLAASEAMEKCGESAAHFCYQAPVLRIQTTDPRTAVAYNAADQIVQGGIGGLQSQLELNADGIWDLKRATIDSFNANKATLGRIFGTTPPTNTVNLAPTGTIRVQAGYELSSVGANKVATLAKTTVAKKTVELRTKQALMNTEFMQKQAIILATVDTAVAATTASGFFTLGLTSFAAATLTAIAVATHIVFGFMAVTIMSVNATIGPIVESLFHTGGVCPSGTKAFSQLVDEPTKTFITNFIPLGMFMETFDPYICWAPDGSVHLKTPPKMPAFMADRTLSLTYHSKWISGNSPNIPTTALPVIKLDPLEPGFTWLDKSDLRNFPITTEIITNARTQANIAITKGATDAANIAGGSSTPEGQAAYTSYIEKYKIINTEGSTVLPSNIAVSDCPQGTDPSTDGLTCNGKPYQTQVEIPTLRTCATGQSDDGFNCWKGQNLLPSGCTGGEPSITTANTWDNRYGHFRVTIADIICTNPANVPAARTAAINGIASTYLERATCKPGYETDMVQTSNGSAIKATFLCYKTCNTGYTREGALCKSASTITRKYQYGTQSLYYDQQMNTEILKNLTEVKVPYCDFSNPVMLDRMAQFYYENAFRNPQINADGTVTVQIITRFVGVVASSELSCDVICDISYISFDPVTGGKYSVVNGCAAGYDGDKVFEGCPRCFRRFYFIQGDYDTQGLFSVTGCTFQDYTAPDAMVISADPGANKIASLPKKFKVVDKQASIMDVNSLMNEINSGRLAGNIAQGQFNTALMVGLSYAGGNLGAAGGRAAGAVTGKVGGLVGGAVGGAGAGLVSSLWLDKAISDAVRMGIDTGEITNAVNTFIIGPPQNLRIVSNNNWWTIDHGPIYEQATGVVPNIDFCSKTIITTDYCAHKYVVRDAVNAYHNTHEGFHIKRITEIEPRGKDGCYYKFIKVLYYPDTHREGEIEEEDEFIIANEISDYATCTFKPIRLNPIVSVDEIDAVGNKVYPVRSYIDPATINSSPQKMIYPTRDTVYTSDLVARFVRVRPPLSGGDGILNLGQIAVFDVSGFNVSTMQATYATSAAAGAATADTVVNGSSNSSSFLANYWQPASANRNSEYWEVDLGANVNIAEIVYIGSEAQTAFASYKAGSGNVGSSYISNGRNTGVRIEFLYSNAQNEIPIETITLPVDDTVQYVPVYSSMYTTPSRPLAGNIIIPRPAPLGIVLFPQLGCQNRCENRDVIDYVISKYNTTNAPNREIIKILRGITSSTSSCEYEAEILIKDTPDTTGSYGEVSYGTTTVVKQYLSTSLSMTPPDGSAIPVGTVTGSFVRFTPSFRPGTVLEISNVIIYGTNINPTNGAKSRGEILSNGTVPNYYNEVYALDQMPEQRLDLGSSQRYGPVVFRARNNDPSTFFEVVLATVATSAGGSTYVDREIYEILFVGQADRMPGGIVGVQVSIYSGTDSDRANPVYTYYLPNDTTVQTIKVVPPSKCTFNLDSAMAIQRPVYLVDASGGMLITTDTSGGVLSVSSDIQNLRTSWTNTLSGLNNSQDLTAPIVDNVKQSDKLVSEILDTVAVSKKIAGTNMTCQNPDLLNAMILAYNISRGLTPTDYYGAKNSMGRILKSGQSTNTTCDVLFEHLYEEYDDYTVDIKDPKSKRNEISAVRFKINNVGGIPVPAYDLPNTDQKNIIDISSNSLGILPSSSMINPPWPSSGGAGVNCTPDSATLAKYRGLIEATVRRQDGYTIRSTMRKINNIFKSTPLTCEYIMTKDYTFTYDNSPSYGFPFNDKNTYVRVNFTLGTDGKTITFKNLEEYDWMDITQDATKTINYIKGKPVYVPNLSYYDPIKKGVSTRISNTPINF